MKYPTPEKPTFVVSATPRRRGRPAGKNRVPLSQEERRARNAQYERERRLETAEAMSQLIEAAQCDPDISYADLLATVISRIQRAFRSSDDISDMRRINANLESQIATLQGRLGLDDESLALLDADDTTIQTEPQSSSKSRRNSQHCNKDVLKKKSKKRKRPERQVDSNQPKKIIKTQSTPADCQEDPQSELADPDNVELPSDFQEVSLDILTDSERRLLSDWLASYSGDDT